MKPHIILLALLLLPLASSAQADFSQVSKQKIGQLDKMVGTWKGTGWMYTPNGKESSDVLEIIQYKLDSTILFIEGSGTKVMDDGSQKKVHDALGVISYHPFTKNYQMNSFISKGLSTNAKVKINEDESIVWWFEAGPNTIRYTLAIANNQWNEIGERSADGENWQQFFEMNLRKVQ